MKFGRSGGLPCLSHYGSWMRQIRFSVFLANSRTVEIIVAWPLVQFNSCRDLMVCEDILFGYSCHGGVSWVGRIIRVRVFEGQILIWWGQLRSVALWGVPQLVQQIGGWVQAGLFLHIDMVHGWSFVL